MLDMRSHAEYVCEPVARMPDCAISCWKKHVKVHVHAPFVFVAVATVIVAVALWIVVSLSPQASVCSLLLHWLLIVLTRDMHPS